MAAALADLGAMVGTRVMVEPLLASGRLVRLFPDWELAPIPLYIAFPPNRHLSTRLRVFVDWVVELMGRVERMQG